MSRFSGHPRWGRPYRPLMNFAQDNHRSPRFGFSPRGHSQYRAPKPLVKGGNLYETGWASTAGNETAYEESYEESYDDMSGGTYDQSYEESVDTGGYPEQNYDNTEYEHNGEVYQDNDNYDQSAQYEYSDPSYDTKYAENEEQIYEQTDSYTEETHEDPWTSQYYDDSAQNYEYFDASVDHQSQNEGRMNRGTDGFRADRGNAMYDGGGLNRGRGGASYDRGRGGANYDRGRGGGNFDRGRGGANYDHRRGGINLDRGRACSDRGRGAGNYERGRGGLISDRGRGEINSARGRGGFNSDRGRGGMTSVRGRGGITSDRGREGMTSDRGRGGMTSDRGRSGLTSDRGRGGMTSDRGRGGMTLDRGRDGMTSDRGRGGMTSERGRGGMTSDRGRGGMTSERGRDGLTSEMGRDGMTSDRGRGGITSDRGRGGMTSYRGRGGMTSERGRGGMASDRGRGGMTSDRGRGGVNSVFGRGGVSMDRGRGKVNSDKGRGGVTSDRGRGGMISDMVQGGVNSARGSGGVISDWGEITSDKGKEGIIGNQAAVKKADDANVNRRVDSVDTMSNRKPNDVHKVFDNGSKIKKQGTDTPGTNVDDLSQEENINRNETSKDKEFVINEEMIIVGETNTEFVIAGETEDEILIMEDNWNVEDASDSPEPKVVTKTSNDELESDCQFKEMVNMNNDDPKRHGQFNMVVDNKYEIDKGQFGFALNSEMLEINASDPHENPNIKAEIKGEESGRHGESDSSEEDTGYCKYCEVGFTSIKAYQTHIRALRHTTLVIEAKAKKGNKHFQKEKVDASVLVANIPKLTELQEEMEGTVDSDMCEEDRKLLENKDLNPNDIGKNPLGDSLYCALCNIHCTGAGTFKMHIAGRQHKGKIELAKQGVHVKKKNPSETVILETTERESKLKDILAPVTTAIIGLEYVTEFQRQDPKALPRYVCNLCESKCDSAAITPHLIGLKHRLKYFEVNDKAMFRYLTAFNSKKRKSEMNANMEDFARDVEKAKGRCEVKVKIEKEAGEDGKLVAEMKKYSVEMSQIVDDIDKGLKPVISIETSVQSKGGDGYEPPMKRPRPGPEQHYREPIPERRPYEQGPERRPYKPGPERHPYKQGPERRPYEPGPERHPYEPYGAYEREFYEEYPAEPYRHRPNVRPRPVDELDPYYGGRYPPDPYDDFRASYRRDFDPYRVEDPLYERRILEERRRLDDLMLDRHRLDDPFAERRRVEDIMERRRYLNELENDRINDIMERRRQLQTQDVDYLRLQRFADRDNVSRSPSLSADDKKRLDSVLARRRAMEDTTKQSSVHSELQDSDIRSPAGVRPTNVAASNKPAQQTFDNLDKSTKQTLIIKTLQEEFARHPGDSVQDIVSKLSSTMVALGADSLMASQMSDALTQAMLQHKAQNASSKLPASRDTSQPVLEQTTPETSIPGLGSSLSSDNVPSFLRSPQVPEYTHNQSLVSLQGQTGNVVTDAQRVDIQAVLAQMGMASAQTQSSVQHSHVSFQQSFGTSYAQPAVTQSVTSQPWTGTSYAQPAVTQSVTSQSWAGTSYGQPAVAQSVTSQPWTGTSYAQPAVTQSVTSQPWTGTSYAPPAMTQSATSQPWTVTSSYVQPALTQTGTSYMQPAVTQSITSQPWTGTTTGVVNDPQNQTGTISSGPKPVQFQIKQTGFNSQQSLSAVQIRDGQQTHSQSSSLHLFNPLSSPTAPQTNETEKQAQGKPGNFMAQNLLESIRQQTELLKQKIQSSLIGNKNVVSSAAAPSYPDPYKVSASRSSHPSTSQSSSVPAPSPYSSQYYQQNYKALPPNSAPQFVQPQTSVQNTYPYYPPHSVQPPLPVAPPPVSYPNSACPPPLPSQPPLPTEHQMYQTNDLPPLRRKR